MEDGEMRRVFLTAAVVLALGLCGCGPAETPRKTAGAQPAPTPMSVTKAPTRPVGPSARHTAIPNEEIGTAADVSQFHALPELSAKIFSLSGGDPAVNGLVTYFALLSGPAEGWSVYSLGDYAEWRVVEAKAGRDIPFAASDDAAALVITEGTVRGLVRGAGDRTPGVLVGRCVLEGDVTVVGEPIMLHVTVSIGWGKSVADTVALFREEVAASLRQHTDLVVAGLDIVVDDLHFEADEIGEVGDDA
jgi:uncharacterized alkaline shock family protein YloU